MNNSLYHWDASYLHAINRIKEKELNRITNATNSNANSPVTQ